MKYSKVHFYTVLEYLPKFALLALIPILQQLIFRPHNFFEIVRSWGITIILIVLVIFWCIAEYRSIRYHAGADYFYIKNGVLINRECKIPYDFIYSVNVKNGVIPYFFGAAKLRLDTPASNSKTSDIRLTLSRRALESAIKNILSEEETENLYRSGIFRILLMVASWANPGVGLLIAAPFINQLGRVLGEEITDRLYSTVSISMELVALGVPPLAAAIAYLLVAGWAVAMIVQLFRYANFSVIRSGAFLIIRRGLVSTQKRMIRLSKIGALSVRQTLFMRIFNLYSAYVQAVGSQKEKGEKSMVISAAKYGELEKSLNGLLKLPIKNTRTIQPPKRAIMGFIFLPLMLLTSIFISWSIIFISGYHSRVYDTFFLFLALIIIWWLILRVTSHRTSGMSVIEGFLIVSGYRKMSLMSSTIAFDKIQKISVVQSPLQRFSNLCNVRVFIMSESREYFFVKNLRLQEVMNIMNILEINGVRST